MHPGANRGYQHWFAAVPQPSMLILLVIGLVFSACALAGSDDKSKPISIQADSSEFDQRSGIQTFSGNVQISQGSMSIVADSIRIETRNGEFYRISGSGNPIRFQQSDDDNNLMRGQSQRIVYDTSTSELIFEGDARFERPGQQFSGHRISYSLEALTFTASGDGDRRVNIVLEPGKLSR